MKHRNGGYKIVSLEGVNFTPSTSGKTQKVAGIYERIEGNHRKPIMLSGIVIDGVERTDRFCEFGMSGTSYLGYMVISDAGNLTITITDEDMVTIENA